MPSTSHLKNVWEVLLGSCTVAAVSSGYTVTGTARVMKHGLPGTPSPGTWFSADLAVRITASVWVDGTERSLQHYNAQDVSTDANGVASFSLTLIAADASPLPANALVRIQASHNYLAPQKPAPFDKRSHTWASLELPLGTWAEIIASPDAADDKNIVASKRAKFQVRRSPNAAGTWAGLPSLAVRVQRIDSGMRRPGDNANLTATYGTVSPGDYYLTGGGWPSGAVALGDPKTVTIPANAEYAELTVVPLVDNLTEANVITLQVIPDTASTYTVGRRNRADVVIYDGPEWTLDELSLSSFGGPTSMSAAYALNNKSGATEPRVSGIGTYLTQDQYGNYVPVSAGGWWQWPAPGTFTPIYNTPYYGLSTSPVKLVGWQGANAYVTTTSTAGFTYLPNLHTAPWQATMAWGINPSATYIVGSSKNSAARSRPVAWSSALTIYDLGGSAAPTQEGYTKAVNDQNQFAGQFNVQYTGGSSGNFAFRTKPGAYPIEFIPQTGYGDVLHAILKNGVDNHIGEASWVNENGSAVGWSLNDQNNPEATYWNSDLPASSAAAIRLMRWQSQSGGAIESVSAAKCINVAGWIVGWSGPVNSPARAVLKRGVTSNPKDWQDLNDRFFVHGSTGWSLKSADAINDLNYIAGNGTLYGQPRAFLLVPRISGN